MERAIQPFRKGVCPSTGEADAHDPPVVIIYSNDPIARRSDPFGMQVKFEVASTRPITRLVFDLPDDGEPPTEILTIPRTGFDGRYVRQFGFKPVVNGDWQFLIYAWDDTGCMGQSDGGNRVTVTF